MPEGRRLLRDLTVEDNLRVATYTMPRGDAAGGIDHALELFPELRKRWDVTAGQLSGGEQQMVVLAQALVSRPKFILVDELSLGLAPVIVKRLAPVLSDVAATGVGVLLIEQFAHVALAVSKSAYVIEGGQIRYKGTAAELKERPELLQSAYLLRDADEDVVEEIEAEADAEEAVRGLRTRSGRYRPRSRSRTSSVHSWVRMIR